MSKLSHQYKYLHLVYANNSLNSPLIHTTRNSGIPNLAREENSNEADYLECLRPAKLNVDDHSNSELAGQPRSNDRFEGIRPEIFEKWNQRPKQIRINKNKEWNKLPFFE